LIVDINVYYKNYMTMTQVIKLRTFMYKLCMLTIKIYQYLCFTYSYYKK